MIGWYANSVQSCLYEYRSDDGSMVYVGQSIHPDQRFVEHRRKNRPWAEWCARKIGWYEVEEIDEMERKRIEKVRSEPGVECFNISSGGSGVGKRKENRYALSGAFSFCVDAGMTSVEMASIFGVHRMTIERWMSSIGMKTIGSKTMIATQHDYWEYLLGLGLNDREVAEGCYVLVSNTAVAQFRYRRGLEAAMNKGTETSCRNGHERSVFGRDGAGNCSECRRIQARLSRSLRL